MKTTLRSLDDPVEAYSRIAPIFGALSDRKRAYLDRIEQLVISEIPSGAQSMLDIGAGDGARALRIARQIGIHELVLIEPSENMRSYWPAGVTAWPIRAEELDAENGSFDVILCLWNVLGHVFPAHARGEVLRQIARFLSPRGVAFIDVNNRYNARHYGVLPTFARFLYDRVLPGERNGDVIASWDVDGVKCSTAGHVFTPREFAALSHSAGLQISKTFLVDYTTGELRSSAFSGNPLYILTRAPR